MVSKMNRKLTRGGQSNQLLYDDPLLLSSLAVSHATVFSNITFVLSKHGIISLVW